MKDYNFVYVTTNLVNGKQYIGDHSTNDLNDGYLGSGKYFINAVKKYGKQNFSRKILEHFKTKEEAFNCQSIYIERYNTVVPNGYNISIVGGTNIKNNRLSEHHKEQLSIAIKKWHQDIGFSQETKKKIGDSQRGKKRSEKSKENYKRGNALKNKGRKMNEDSKKIMIQKLKGQKRSNQFKINVSLGSKNSRKQCEKCNKIIPLNVYNRCHGKKCTK